jgi:hypothetical protein
MAKVTERTYYTEEIHNKLVRKAKREHWQRISYHTPQDGVRNGWVIEDTGKVTQKNRPFVTLV